MEGENRASKLGVQRPGLKVFPHIRIVTRFRMKGATNPPPL